MEKSEIIQIIKEELKLLERELTDKELKRRDKIADELPDAEFKKRYGKDYKSVKYATATKMAKREENDPEDGKAAPHGSGYNVVKEYNIQALRSLRKVVNEAAMYKKGQKVQYQIDRGSSNALKPSTGTISKIQKKGNSYVYTVQDGGPVPVHELEIIALTEAFKKGDKVKYLDQPGVITNVEDKMGKTYYSVKYKGPNGTRKAKGVLSTDGSITEAVYDNILKAVPDSYSYKNLAADIARMIKDEYGSHNIKPFTKALMQALKEGKITVDESVWKHFDAKMKLYDEIMDVEDEMRDITNDLKQLHIDMEQEAEPGGGPKATKYGREIEKKEKEYKKKKAEFKKLMAKLDKMEQY